MSYPQKIVTCCYCGHRAALVLGKERRHELACASCGAPLHNLKMLPKKERSDVPPTRYKPDAKPKPFCARPSLAHRQERPQGWVRRRKKKKMIKKLFEGAFDLIEDIFD